MDEQGFSSFNKIVGSAKVLSGLDSASIWALITALLVIYFIWTRKKEVENAKEWRLIREKQIASEVAQTEVLKQMTTEIVSLKMMITKFLLKE